MLSSDSVEHTACALYNFLMVETSCDTLNSKAAAPLMLTAMNGIPIVEL